MIPDIGGGIGAKLVTASIVVAIALIVFFLVARAWRRRNAGLSPRGSKHRGPRLAVLDTAAVDQRRRLVLVRRDDVEHLIMIGGPTDVVIESRIGAEAPAVEPMQPGQSDEPTGAAFPAPAIPSSAMPPVAEPVTVQPEQIHADEPVTVPARRASPTAEAERPQAEPAGLPTAPDEPEPAPQVERVATVSPAAHDRRADIANLLDSHRKRVLGQTEVERRPSETEPQPSVLRAYLDDDDDVDLRSPLFARQSEPSPTPKRPGSVLRFEDFLDPEITGDLSSVTAAPAPAAKEPRIEPLPAGREQDAAHAPRAAQPEAEGPRSQSALDDEMARFLRQLSDKR